MSKIVGLLVVLLGIFTGVYLGLWVCFIGGILDIVKELKADDMVLINIGYGVLKIVLANIVGWGVGVFIVIPGLVAMSR